MIGDQDLPFLSKCAREALPSLETKMYRVSAGLFDKETNNSAMASVGQSNFLFTKSELVLIHYQMPINMDLARHF